MSVTTVLGEIDSKDLGIIDPHNHLLCDIRSQFTETGQVSKKAVSDEKITMEKLGMLSRNPYAIKDNLCLNDMKLAKKELLQFKNAGGTTFVDATPRDMGRNPEALKDIASSSGIHIIAGCGYYTYDTHPKDLATRTVQSITDELISEIKIGIDSSDIKAGIIGEIGTSQQLHTDEEKVLTASAKAHEETRAGILVHTYPWTREALKILQLLSSAGADIHKIVICHIDVDIDLEYCTAIAQKGAYIEFDSFGKQYYIDKKNRGYAGLFATDIERVRAIKKLIDKGFLDHILITCDIVFKSLLHQYGGWGYDHVLTNIIPMMDEFGIQVRQIEQLIRENPKRMLNM